MKTKVIFCDTNLLLQCKPIEQLPWADIAVEQDVLLLVPFTVVIEIDKLKGTSGRRAKKARKICSLFKSMCNCPDNAKVVVDAIPRVKLGILSPYSLSARSDLPSFLDLSKMDDCILAEVFAYKKDNKDKKVFVLSHDAGILFKGGSQQLEGISILDIPDDWLLEPENDSTDKEINKLKQELQKYTDSVPKISIVASDDNGDVFKEKTIEIVYCPKPTVEEIDDIIRRVKLMHPKVTNFEQCKNSNETTSDLTIEGISRLFPSKYIPPGQGKIERYHYEYDEYIEGVVNFLRQLPGVIEESSRHFTFNFRIKNDGFVPAESVLLRFRLYGGMRFGAATWPKKEIKLPEPPIPPKGRMLSYEEMVTGSGGYNGLSTMECGRGPLSLDYDSLVRPYMPEPVSQYAFYWNVKPAFLSENCEMHCHEIRHKADAEEIDLPFYIPRMGMNDQSTGVAECIFSAKNLPDIVAHRVNIHVKHVIKNALQFYEFPF